MATSRNVRIEGFGDLDRYLRRASAQVLDAAEDALVIEANEDMTEAKGQTPVDTGTLRGSGTVFPVQRRGSKVSVELGFGGAAGGADGYAVPVHERMGVHHPVGNAKFLELPVLAGARRFRQRLHDEIGRALRKAARR